MTDVRDLYHIAEAILDDAERLFIQGIGSAPTAFKNGGDFATDMDLKIEQYLRTQLVMMTGIPVFGEEYGGKLGTPMWVVDPIDGTANYAAGNPMSSILISLIADGEPVIGLTSVPMVGQRFGAYADSPLLLNGQVQPQMSARDQRHVSHVGFTSIASPRESSFPTVVRQGLLGALAQTYLRPRITGSVGIDLAYAAAGIFDAALSLSPNLWDNAAGIMLVRAAGGVVTDLDGNQWTPTSEGVIVGSARSHEVLMATIDTMR